MDPIIDFKGLLDELEPDEIFAIANQARPGTNYMFNAILPEVERDGYEAKAGSMTVRATMAKLVGMDSPYPRAGVMESSDFKHQIAKMAVELPFSEQYLRELRQLVTNLLARGAEGKEQILDTLFNFMDVLLVQPHLDTAEWLRGQALFTGKIDWQSDDIHLEVDYGIPSGNFLPARTGSDAYGGSTSKFWDDIQTIQQKLAYRVRGYWLHSDTLRKIVNNPVNNLKIIEQNELAGVYHFKRYIQINGQNMVSEDVRDDVKIMTYDDEGEVFDDMYPGTGKTKKIPFCPRGGLLAVGDYNPKRFVVGAGSQPAPTRVQLGFTHVGPTEEGSGRLGRWAKAYVPQGKEYMFIGQSVSNVLPVIEAPDRIVVATTQM